MPLMVEIEPNPDYQTKPGEGAVVDAVKKLGPLKVPEVTAAEAIRNSGGMYRIKPAPKPVAEIRQRALEDMSAPELVSMAASLGYTIRKEKMPRSALLKIIRDKLESVEVTDD